MPAPSRGRLASEPGSKRTALAQRLSEATARGHRQRCHLRVEVAPARPGGTFAGTFVERGASGVAKGPRAGMRVHYREIHLTVYRPLILLFFLFLMLIYCERERERENLKQVHNWGKGRDRERKTLKRAPHYQY